MKSHRELAPRNVEKSRHAISPNHAISPTIWEIKKRFLDLVDPPNQETFSWGYSVPNQEKVSRFGGFGDIAFSVDTDSMTANRVCSMTVNKVCHTRFTSPETDYDTVILCLLSYCHTFSAKSRNRL